MGQPYVRFANIRLYAGWNMNVTLGASTPATCSITTVPHLDHLERFGDLVLGEEGEGELVIPGCAVETPYLNEDLTWTIPVIDRRWRNRFGEIDGHYNIKRPDKTFLRERTPQELAALCLEAMGEPRGRWDIGRLPNYARPEIEWDNDNPAEMLDDLVGSLGCVVSLDYFQNQYVIWPIGQGADLPDGPTQSRAAGLSATVKPDLIKSLSAHIMYQARFACEAVGKDTDGKIKRLEDLSFDPLEDDDPVEFGDTGFDSNGEDIKYTERGEEKTVNSLAKEWCHKTFRIIGVVKKDETIKASTATNIERLPSDGWSPEALKGNDSEPERFADIKLLDHRAEQYIDEEDTPGSEGHDRKVDKDIAVYARYYDEENLTSDKSKGMPRIPALYKGGSNIDTRLGLVRVSDPLFLKDADDRIIPAEVFVDVAFYAGKDGHLVRKVTRFETGENNSTGARVLKQEDVEIREIQTYGFRSVGSGGDNPSYKCALEQTSVEPEDWQQQLQYYIDAVLPEYDPLPSYTRHYKKLMAIVPDGRIRQVSWSGGGGDSASTRVSLNTEHDNWTPTVEDNRRKLAADKAIKDRQNAKLQRRRERLA